MQMNGIGERDVSSRRPLEGDFSHRRSTERLPEPFVPIDYMPKSYTLGADEQNAGR